MHLINVLKGLTSQGLVERGVPRTLNVVFALLLGFILLAGCSKPSRIEGTVLDVFGQAIADVSIAIDGSAYKARTASSGRFEIEYAPGEFVVSVSKDGFSSQRIELKLTQSQEYSLAEVKLYPIPAESGIYLIDHVQKKLVALDVCGTIKLEREGLGGTGPVFYTYRIPPESRSSTYKIVRWPTGSYEFIAKDMEEQVLSRTLDVRGSIMRFTAYLGQEKDLSQRLLPIQKKDIGIEKLQVLTVELTTEGIYNWHSFYIPLGNRPYPLEGKEARCIVIHG